MAVGTVISLMSLVALFAAPAANARDYTDLLPLSSERPDGFSYPELLSRLSDAALSHIEGVWEFRAQGMTVAVERDRSGSSGDVAPGYRMTIVSSLNRAIRPGTVIGHIAEGSDRQKYEARIFTAATGSTLRMPKRFLLELSDDDSTLTFRHKQGKFSVNLLRMFPFAWRYPFYKNHQEGDAGGAVRIFPRPSKPFEPVYL